MLRKLPLGLLLVFLFALAVQALPGGSMTDEARNEMFWKMATMKLGLTADQVSALKQEFDSPLFQELKTTLRPQRQKRGQNLSVEERTTKMTEHMTTVIDKLSANESAIIDSLLKAYALLDPTQRRIIAAHLEHGPMGPRNFPRGRKDRDTNQAGVIDDAGKSAGDKPTRKLKTHRGQGRGGHRGGRRLGQRHGGGPFHLFRPTEALRKSIAGHISGGTLDQAVMKEAFAGWREQAQTALKTLPEKLAAMKSEKRGNRGRQKSGSGTCMEKCPQACPEKSQ